MALFNCFYVQQLLKDGPASESVLEPDFSEFEHKEPSAFCASYINTMLMEEVVDVASAPVSSDGLLNEVPIESAVDVEMFSRIL